MKKLGKILLFILFVFYASSDVFASHIVTLKVYRDCSSLSPFDVNPGIGIFDELTNTLVSVFYIDSPIITRVDPVITNPCLAASAVCIEEGLYSDTVTLPTSTRAYYLSYSRCCRNSSISNITTPGAVGMTISVRIPPSSTTPNSNPQFNAFPPVYICQNAPLVFNYSATDLDGDSLYYQLCAPYAGGSIGIPMPVPSPAPYTPLTYVAPYSAIDPLGSSPPPAIAMTIDPRTGVLTGIPPTVGQYVMPVCVTEYRAGVYLSTTMRDFQINVIPCPVPFAAIPSYDINPSTGIGTFALNCDDNNISFLNTSTGSLFYHWDFGENLISTDTSNLMNPTYTYSDTGTYFVTLVAYNSSGCLDSTNAYVKIYPGLVANFSTSNFCLDSSVRYSDLSVSPSGAVSTWKWSFGDGDSSLIQNPAHHYRSSGLFTTNLYIKNSVGCDTTVSKVIRVFPQPAPNFTVDSTCINAPVAFRNTTTISTGSILSYDWNFGDGSLHSTVTNPSHIYISTGTFTVTLTVYSDSGCSKSITKNVVIHSLPIIRTCNDTIFCSGGSGVQSAASGGTTYLWSPSIGLSNTHISNPIANPPTSTVYYISVGDTNRCQNTDSVIVTMATLSTDFIFTNECMDTSVQFTDISSSVSSTINQWKWTFGDLTTGTIQNPSHLYISSGLFNVKLVITSDKGCKDSVTKVVRIYPIPHPGFINDSSCINNAIYFEDTTRYILVGDSISIRTWSWGDGTPNTVGPANTTHTYASAGTFTVTLSVQTDSGCTESYSRNIIVHPRPIITTSNDTFLCPGSSTQIAANGGINYIWSPGTALSSTRIANPFSSTLSSITYHVIVADTNKCQSSDSVRITMYANAANFSFTNECEDTAVHFFDLSASSGGVINQWTWSFGDNTGAFVQNPTHLYNADSLYPVKLVFTTNKGCKDSITQNVRIYPITNPGFIFDTTCINSPVYFEDTTHYFYSGDTILSREWNWGDGSPNTLVIPSTNHTYLSAGTYVVTLTVRTDSGCTQSFRRSVIIHPRPTILTSNDTFICPGSTTQIAASGGVNYSWSPSSTLNDSTLSHPISNTLNDIVYYVRVTDVNSCQNIDSVKVRMYINHADFDFTNECKDTSVQFTDLSTTTGGIINQWKWTFGDASTDIIQNPAHLYGSAGNYTAKLVFITDRGCRDSIAKTLLIYPIPNPGFIFDSTCINNAVYFEDTTHYYFISDSIQTRMWTWGDGTPATLNIPTANHTYTSTGNYSIKLTVTSDSGCTQSISRLVSVHPLPVIDLLHDTSICPNLSVQYMVLGGTSYIWNTDSTLSDTSINNPIASPVTDNTYFVRVIDANRCQNRDSAHITIFILHPVSAGLDTSVCLSPTSFFDSVQLTGTGGVSYAWTPAYNISNTSIFNPWVAPDTNTNYRAMITDLNGCIQFDTVRVVVLDPALDILTAKDTFLCKNDTIQIRVIDQGVDGYTWTPVLNLSNPTIQSPRFYPTDTTTYFVQVLNYCYTKKDTMQFFVYDLPVPDFTFDTTCIHSAVNFTDLSLGTLRGWLWDFGDDSSSNLQDPIHTYNNLGAFMVRLIDTTNLGCYDSISKSITIHPTPILTPMKDTILCQNKFTTFQTNNGMRYFWSPSTDLDNANISNPTTIVLTNGIYTVTVSDSNKCQSFDTVSTTYDLLFPRFFTQNECKDTLVHFSDSSTSASGVINRWRWDFGDGYASPDQHPSHLYGYAGVFNVNLFFETSNGCDTNITSSVEVYPLPILNPDNDTICLGESYQIIADSTYTLIWSANATLSSLTSYHPIANPSVTTHYYVSLKDTNYCVNKDTFTLQVNYKPNIYISSPNAFFCKGDTVLLEAHTTAGHINWTPANLLNDSTSITSQAFLTDTITYFARVIDDAGCFNIDSILLYVQQPTTAIAFMNDTICRGNSVTLYAEGGKYYNWTPANYLNNSLNNHVESTPDSTIQYTINVSNDCFSDDTVVTVYVNQLPKANAGPDITINRSETTTLSATGGISYSWFPSELVQNPEGAVTDAAPLFTTNYSVMVTDINGCIAYDTVLIKVEANTKIIVPTAFSPDGNGVNDLFRISKTLNIEHLITFEVYDRWGNLVFSTTDIKSGWDGNYNNHEQPIGSYTWMAKAVDYDGGTVTRTGIVTLLR